MASVSLTRLPATLEQIAKAIEADVNDFTRTVATEVQYDLAAATPVDTGQARSNWVMRLGSPFGLTYKPYTPYPSAWRPPYVPGPGKAETAKDGIAIKLHDGAEKFYGEAGLNK